MGYANTTYWDRAYLNKNQKVWLEKFKLQYPDARVTDVYRGLSGDRILTIAWTERMPDIIVSGCINNGYGIIFHQIKVKLRIFGDPREPAQYHFRTCHRCCDIEQSSLISQGQICLPISQLLVEPNYSNPVVPKAKRKGITKKTVRANLSKQVQIPLEGDYGFNKD